MKLSCGSFLFYAASAAAFQTRTFGAKSSLLTGITNVGPLHMSAVEETSKSSLGSDFQSSAPSIYDRLGFTESEIGQGVDPKSVLQWLGTKEDLVAKVMKDNKGFDESRATEQVMKLMMDTEMVSKFIAYEKKKADPDFQRKEREQQLTDPGVIALYAAWIVGGAGFAVVKNTYINPKFASGEWQEIHIQLPTPFWMDSV